MQVDEVLDRIMPCSNTRVVEPSEQEKESQESIMLRGELEELTVELTQDCLNRCMYCSSLSGSIPTYPPMEQALFSKLIDEAVGLRLRRLYISGGEPFLHTDLARIFQVIRDSDLEEVVFFTSGVVRSDDDSPAALPFKLLMDLLQLRSTKLIFNIQSCNEAIHDRIVGAKGRLATALKSMRAAIDSNIPVECHIVPNRLNINTLIATTHMLIEMGVSRISFLRMVPQGNARKNPTVLLNHHANRRLNKAIEELNLLAEKGYPIRLGVPFSGRCGRFSPCKAGISKLIARWDGAVFPCEAFKECGASSLCLGQAGEQSLSELLSKARENKALIGLRQRVDSLEPCPAQILYQAIENRESI